MSAPDVRALTIRQPWASLIATGAKTIETRSWSTDWRGRLLIHAGAWVPPEGMEVGRYAVERWRDTPGKPCLVTDEDHARPDPLPLGAVVAVATLSDCWPISCSYAEGTTSEVYDRLVGVDAQDPTDHDRGVTILGAGPSWFADRTSDYPLGDFTPGRYAWLLTDVRPIDPVPAKGKQGLWKPDADLIGACCE